LRSAPLRVIRPGESELTHYRRRGRRKEPGTARPAQPQIRTSGDPNLLLNTLRSEIRAADRSVALGFIGTDEDFINQLAMAQPRFGCRFLLLVEDQCLGHKLAFGVSAFGSLRQRLAVLRNDSATRKMVFSAGLAYFPACRIRV
jgi:hypothetical protein